MIGSQSINKLTMTKNFKPAQLPERILLGPGPCNVDPRVLHAMSKPITSYKDPAFLNYVEEVSEMLKILFQTNENTTFAISGTGSAGMEAGINSLLEPSDTIIICNCGFFGERMAEMAKRIGCKTVVLEGDWGKPFPIEKLESELKKHKQVKLIAAVQAETSTGILQDIQPISKLARSHNAFTMIDSVTSLGGNTLKVDEWNLDYCYSASQKCLACPPGLSPVALSPRARESIKNRNTPPSSWYLDLNLIAGYWDKPHTYHHTIPISLILGLHEALRILLEEGIEVRFERHRQNGEALRNGVEALGLKLLAPNESKLDQVTPIWIPEGIDGDKIQQALLNDYNIEIGTGFGKFAGKIWRIGLMGESSKSEYVLKLLSAFEEILPKEGFEIASGIGVEAASETYLSFK